MSGGTVRKRCTCENKFQDDRYGKQIRLMNRLTGREGARCTSCKREHYK